MCDRPKAKDAAGEEKLPAAAQAAPFSDQVSVYWGLDFEALADAVMFKLDAMERSLVQQKKDELQM